MDCVALKVTDRFMSNELRKRIGTDEIIAVLH